MSYRFFVYKKTYLHFAPFIQRILYLKLSMNPISHFLCLKVLVPDRLFGMMMSGQLSCFWHFPLFFLCTLQYFYIQDKLKMLVFVVVVVLSFGPHLVALCSEIVSVLMDHMGHWGSNCGPSEARAGKAYCLHHLSGPQNASFYLHSVSFLSYPTEYNLVYLKWELNCRKSNCFKIF